MEAQIKKPATLDLSHDEDSRLLDYYRILRGQIEHEDNLVGSRASVFVTSQSFLFSAYAIIANGILPRTPDGAVDPKRVLLVLIPAVAIMTSVLLFWSIVSGVFAMRQLRVIYKRFSPKLVDFPLPPIQGTRSTRIGGSIAPVLLPPLFTAVWAYLLYRRLF